MKDDLVARLRELLAMATPGPWEVDTTDNEGEYGFGPDTVSGFKSPVMLDPHGKVLFDAVNGDLIEVHEEYDEDGCYAWDDPGRCNFDLIAVAINTLPDLLGALEAAQARIAELEGAALAYQNELGDRDAAVYDVVKAVLAEREACAKVAECDNGKMRGGNYAYGPTVSYRIAAAIRERANEG